MPFFLFVFFLLFSGPVFAQGETFSILSIQPVSSTEIHLTASDPITLSPDAGARAFSITDAAGSPLALTQLILRGPRISLFTLPQTPGEHYALTLSDDIRGKVPQGEGWRAVALDAGSASYAFVGFAPDEDRKEEPPPPESLVPPSPLIASVSETLSVSSPLHTTQTVVFVAVGGLLGWLISRTFRNGS